MLIVEESGRWAALFEKRFGQRYQFQVVNAAGLQPDLLSVHRIVGLEFHPACFDHWLSLFDKTQFNLENSVIAVMGGTLNSYQKAGCRELGFYTFIDDLDSLNSFVASWHFEMKPVSSFDGLKQEVLRRIDWLG